MKDYFISDYTLSCSELFQSLFLSSYAFRHLEEAKIEPEHRWGHWIIATIEFVPLLGQTAMLIEWIFFRCMGEQALKNIKLFTGSQQEATGFVSRTQALEVVQLLNQERRVGIHFNPSKVESHLTGGACSAMSFAFAESFFRAKQNTSATLSFFLDKIRALGAQFSHCSATMRMRQAAFNTIEVEQGGGIPLDFSKNKVESLARFYRFGIDHASTTIDVQQSRYQELLKKEITLLPEGVYLFRTIKPARNEKLEELGHSMIYVKENRGGFFYDPNGGAYYFKSSSYFQLLSHALDDCFTQFGTSHARFYRLTQI